MKIITFKDISDLNIQPTTCFEWAENMIKNKRTALLPPKTSLKPCDGVFCNVMPSMVLYPRPFGGVKTITRYPNRVPSLESRILLLDADTGSFLALMDGTWITAMRTGAVAAHSIIHLAKENWSNIGMIGLGNVARSSLLVLASKVDKPITVKLFSYKDQAELFAERFKDFKKLTFDVVDSVEECIKGSDVVISAATYFKNDIAPDEWFDEGVLVVPIHTRGFTNCDLFFDKVFADDTDHVKDFKNFSMFRYYAEVSDVVCGRAEGRSNDKERILAYNIGISIHDINFAAHIYQMFEQMPEAFNRLADVDMLDPVDKFWV